MYPEGMCPERTMRAWLVQVDFGTVRKVVEADLGRRLEDVYRSFDPTPLASASIAQVSYHASRRRCLPQLPP